MTHKTPHRETHNFMNTVYINHANYYAIKRDLAQLRCNSKVLVKRLLCRLAAKIEDWVNQ